MFWPGGVRSSSARVAGWVEGKTRMRKVVEIKPLWEASSLLRSLLGLPAHGFDLQALSHERCSLSSRHLRQHPSPTLHTPVWSNFKGNGLFVQSPSLGCINKQMGNQCLSWALERCSACTNGDSSLIFWPVVSKA